MQKQSNNCWLNDRIINAAQGLLKANGIPGLQNTLLGSRLTFGKRYVCSSTVFRWRPLADSVSHWLCIFDSKSVWQPIHPCVKVNNGADLCSACIQWTCHYIAVHEHWTPAKYKWLWPRSTVCHLSQLCVLVRRPSAWTEVNLLNI